MDPPHSFASNSVSESQFSTLSESVPALSEFEGFDVVVIGAGAAGLMCAAVAGQLGAKVLVVDHAKKIGEKIRISGGGRCNFTNRTVGAENFVSKNPNFCRSALSQYRPSDFIDLVERYEISYHEKHKGQLFCDSSSQQIIDMLFQECAQGNVKVKASCRVEAVQRRPNKRTDDVFTSDSDSSSSDVQSEYWINLRQDGDTDFATGSDVSRSSVRGKNLVIATGGLSIPKIGASDFGYRLAKQFGHSIIPTEPSLVPLIFDAGSLPSLPGLALPVKVSCTSAFATKGKQTFSEDLLFTHKGLSGPAILQISNYWEKGESLTLNFLPEITLWEHLKLTKTSSRQSLAQVLQALLPKRLVEVMVPASHASQRVAELSDQVLREIAQVLQNLVVTPTGSEGFQKAEVTRGGVNTSELHQATMESRLSSGLFMIGEVVDVTGWLGGYNFQWAWSSGVACGRELGRRRLGQT
jgi:predicted flavoprotein YhiN